MTPTPERPTGTEALTHIAKLIKERDPKPTGTEVDTSAEAVGRMVVAIQENGDYTPEEAWEMLLALQAERDAAVRTMQEACDQHETEQGKAGMLIADLEARALPEGHIAVSVEDGKLLGAAAEGRKPVNWSEGMPIAAALSRLRAALKGEP